MASVFKRGRDHGKKSAVWYISYTDECSKRRTLKGFRDKGLTEQLGSKMDTEVMLRKRGLIDVTEERLIKQRQSATGPHLSVFESHLGNNTSKHVKLTMMRVRRVIDGCTFESLGDISAEKVKKFLDELRVKEDFGNRTYNHYLQAADSFGRWLVETNRLPRNPFLGIERLNAEVDIRHKRRALTAGEIKKLAEAARSSDRMIQTFTGEQRARLYILSFMTGLRRSELASLTPRSFSLDSDPPIVTIQAACSKHRKTDVLPLHPELVMMLREWLVGMRADEFLFPKLARKKAWFMVQWDMKKAGIEYVNEHGIADFHAAGRHSHITELIRSGVSLAEARELARHSDIRMTMRYTHIGMDDKAKAIKQLPWQRNGSDSGVSERQTESKHGNNRRSQQTLQENTNPCQSRGCDKDRHQVSLDDIDAEERRARDSNPQPIAGQLISNQSASHSLTLRRQM